MRNQNILRVSVCVAAFLVSAAASADTIAGRTLELDGVTPIADVIVILQPAGAQTLSQADGSFVLEVGTGTDLVVVGAKKTYFNHSVTVDAGATGADILLTPVPQDNDPNYVFRSPSNCSLCHSNQFAEWVTTPMAMAGSNTWVHDLYSGTGTPGGMGGFVYLRDSVLADTNPASECASCHQPQHWLRNLYGPMVGPNDPPSSAAAHGVGCDVCHKIADVDVSKINFPGLYPGAVTVTRPAAPGFAQVQYGILPDVDYRITSLMRASYQPQLEAEVCGACHQDKNDLNDDHTFAGVISEPTYIEWRDSVYSDRNSALYASCADCHMPVSDLTQLCDVIELERPLGSIRSHRILGTTPEYLDNAVELDLQTQVVGDELHVDVAITNAHTGHHVPTGVTVRNMILLVQAWKQGDDPFIAPLAQSMGGTIHALGGVGDPTLGYYAGLPGVLFTKLIEDADGNAPTFFTDATGIIFDNRIPALATDSSSYRFALPLDGGTVHIRAKVLYRRAFRALVDAKQWTQDGHGNPLEDVLPPHYGHLMEQAQQTVLTGPIGGACCEPGGVCTIRSEQDCVQTANGIWFGVGTDCSDADADGRPDLCESVEVIPAVSSWGLLVLALLLLTFHKLGIGKLRRSTG